MNNAGIRPLIFESLFVTAPLCALARHHVWFASACHEIAEEVLLHHLALFVQVCDW
jgi:hypothetical protein